MEKGAASESAMRGDGIRESAAPADALRIRNLSHRYGRRVALDAVNLAVPAGRVCGLLGRNGAGKTTLLNIVSTAMRPQTGEVLVFGRRASERPGVLSRMCLVREYGMFPSGARLSDLLYGCSRAFPAWDRAYARRAVEMFELDTKKSYKQLSRGMESSLGLVIGLASRAELTMFDEPSLGLDAAMRERFYDELHREARSSGRTMLVSTHLIDEVSRVFQDVAILDRGRVSQHRELQALLDGYLQLTGSRADVEQAARGHRVIHMEALDDGRTRFVAEWDGSPAPGGVEAERPSLQRLFVYLTEEEGA
ncbi:MAG: ABC transporter ATP-binding protein [Clostridiales bacterium]|nr:ABC transporter ATP-binding protein [Clostridiales bacterium]